MAEKSAKHSIFKIAKKLPPSGVKAFFSFMNTLKFEPFHLFGLLRSRSLAFHFILINVLIHIRF